MSSFKNVSDVDLDVQVDGRRYFAQAGGEFTIPDEFDCQFVNQPTFELSKVPKPIKAEIVSDATEEKN